MNIEPGTIVVIIAVLVFYLRLIILQRQKVKRVQHGQAVKTGRKQQRIQVSDGPRYSILSANPLDRWIATGGMLVIILGVLLNAGVLPFPAWQAYWWIPTSLGIIAFSWGFRL